MFQASFGKPITQKVFVWQKLSTKLSNPVSNLSFASKLIENVVGEQLKANLETNNLSRQEQTVCLR